MTRSVSAYKNGYIVSNPGATDLDRLLGNFVVLLDHAATPVQIQADTAPTLGGDLNLQYHRIYSSWYGFPISIVPAGPGGFRLNNDSQGVGYYSVDLQRYVTATTQSAGGQYALAEGACNTASADHSHAEGFHAVADQYGAHTECTSDWISRRAQRTDVSLCGQSSNASTVYLSADGQRQGLVVPANVTWLCEVHILAVMDYGYTSAWVLRFVVQNNGVNVHFVGVAKDEGNTPYTMPTPVLPPSTNALAKECTGAWVSLSISGGSLLLFVQNPYETTKNCGTSWHADFHITELSMVSSGGTGGTVI